jgi:hypothetical protein
VERWAIGAAFADERTTIERAGCGLGRGSVAHADHTASGEEDDAGLVFAGGLPLQAFVSTAAFGTRGLEATSLGITDLALAGRLRAPEDERAEQQT